MYNLKHYGAAPKQENSTPKIDILNMPAKRRKSKASDKRDSFTIAGMQAF